MKMSTAMLNSLGSALSTSIGSSGVYAFITADTRTLDDIRTAVSGAGVTPAAAGFASLTGSNGTSLDYLTNKGVTVGSSSISVTYSSSSPMTASAAGTATYLVLCNYSSLTSGSVTAVLPIGGTGSSAPMVMDNTTVVVGDKIKVPTLTFSIPIPS